MLAIRVADANQVTDANQVADVIRVADSNQVADVIRVADSNQVADVIRVEQGETSMGRITLAEGNIVEQSVDAIVNAANERLVLGSGVAGAIRDAGGPEIQAECDAHGGIEVGGAAVTGAGQLPARWVIHAAGMPLGGGASEESVRGSLRATFEAAAEVGAHTLAVPALGTGVGGFGLQRCAEVSLEEARRALDAHPEIEEIRFVLFGEPAYRLFEMVNDAAKVAAQMERLKKR